MLKYQFPIFKNNPNLVYLDNASTTQKPEAVIKALSEFYENSNANVHRGLYPIAATATKLWEEAHDIVAKFIGAKGREEIIFTSGTTDSINLIAQLLIKNVLKDGDIVVLSEMEHHSNIIPWQLGQKFVNYEIAWIPVTSQYQLDFEWYEKLLAEKGDRVKVVSLVHTSNVIGVTNDVAKFFNLARKVGAITILDAAQSVAHIKIDVNTLNCDFLAFSGHKVYGPTGIGVLYGRKELLGTLDPVWGGGQMISSVSKDGAKYNDLPWKFEGGTPNISGGIGLGVALDWFVSENLNVTQSDPFDGANGSSAESELTRYLYAELTAMPEINIISTQEIVNLGSSVISFTVKGIHPHDIVSLLADEHICVRGGYHCAEILHKEKVGESTVRCSFGCYNTKDDVAKFIAVLKKIILMFN